MSNWHVRLKAARIQKKADAGSMAWSIPANPRPQTAPSPESISTTTTVSKPPPTKRNTDGGRRPLEDSANDRGLRVATDSAPGVPASAPISRYAGLVSAKKRKAPASSVIHLGLLTPSESNFAPESEAFANRSSTRPYAPPKKLPRANRLAYDDVQSLTTRTTSQPSDWYAKINMKEKFSRADLANLQHVNTLIVQCEREAARRGDAEVIFAKIRQRLHQMQFFDFLSGVVVKKSKVLDELVGLPRIYLNAAGVEYPWDIRADAEALQLRWLQGVLDPHLLRGIDSSRKVRAEGKSAIAHRLEKDYPARKSCNVVGHNNLLNGQWWPMQICALRDGAHGEVEGGIHGQPGKGAFSIILSSGGYADRDDGERILYCGTSGSKDKPTAGTNHLTESYGLQQPVRVLRSAALPQSNRYRPAKGLRYDGLYEIVGSELLDGPTAMYRFSLRRQPDQDPIRYQGVEARPTDEECAAYTKIRKLIGLAT